MGIKLSTFYCSTCKKHFLEPVNSFGTGYASMPRGRKKCYACCDLQDVEDLRALPVGDKIYGFYLVTEKCAVPGETQTFVTNWPGTFKQQVTWNDTRNNWGAKVRHFWFKSPDGHEMYGRVSGENKDCADFILKTKKTYHYNKDGFCCGIY